MVGDLVARLSALPADARVMVCGYESGFVPVSSVSLTELQELSGCPDWMGHFQYPGDAAQECASGTWQISNEAPPELVGEPVAAVILWRRGR